VLTVEPVVKEPLKLFAGREEAAILQKTTTPSAERERGWWSVLTSVLLRYVYRSYAFLTCVNMSMPVICR
jgi:hypothetical protein